MSVGIVVGTRPEAVKLKPVVDELIRRMVPVFVIASGQHDLSEYGIIFDKKIDPSISKTLSLGEKTGVMITELSGIFEREDLSSVIVQGDTATVLAAAIAAHMTKIPVVHVEAGLRTGDLECPYPEESVRQMVSRIAALNCAPTEMARRELLGENVSGKIVMTGNTIVDALVNNGMEGAWPEGWRDSQTKILVTCHRRENWGKRTEELVEALMMIPHDVHVVLHPNPSARGPFNHIFSSCHESISHREMVSAIKMADVVITDSGGMAEEAAIMGTRTVIFRDKTERMEAVNSGVADLVPDAKMIPKAVEKMLKEGRMQGISDFGDGTASTKIVNSMDLMGLL